MPARKKTTKKSTTKPTTRSGSTRESEVAAKSKSTAKLSKADKLHQEGIDAYRKGNLSKAAQTLQKAIELEPQSAAALCNLGTVLKVQGQLEQAKACYKKALTLHPDDADVLMKLGNLYSDQDDWNQAVSCYEKVVKKRPRSHEVRNNLATALQRLGQYEQAKQHAQAAVKTKPTSAYAQCNLGNILKSLGDYENAVEHLQKAVQLDNKLPDALMNLALLYGEIGLTKQATEALRQVIAINPDSSEAYYHLAITIQALMTEDDLAAMHQLINNPSLNRLERARLHMALGAALDTRTEYEAAAGNFKTANAILGQVYKSHDGGYDPGYHSQIINQIIETYTSEYMNKAKCWGIDTVKPVFLVGFPRSGTTLIEQILDCHTEIHGAGELMLIPNEFDNLPQRLHRSHLSAIECIRNKKLKRHLHTQLANDLLQKINQINPDARYIVDKMPDNYHFVGFIHTLFPKAKIIHCKRDLRDTALSCWMSDFSGIHWAARPEYIAARMKNYLRLMAHWSQILPSDILIETEYEHFIEMPPIAAHRIFQYLHLEWNNAYLEFHKHVRPSKTPGYGQVRKRLYRHAMGRWKKYCKYMPWLIDVIPSRDDPNQIQGAA